MAELRHNPYMDFEDGNGFVSVKFYDIKLLFNKARKINAFIQRDYLEGSCTIRGTDATKAITAFTINSKFKLNLKVYLWGTDITGTLIWEGSALIKSKFDLNRTFVEFSEFETIDIYSPWLNFFSENLQWNLLDSPQDSGQSVLATEGVGVNTSQIQTLNWDGTNWTSVGTPLSIPLTGKPSITGNLAVYDNVTQTITNYLTIDSGLSWLVSSLGTKTTIFNAEVAGLAFRSSNRIALVDQGNKQIMTYLEITGGWLVEDVFNINRDCKNPDLCLLYSGVTQIFAYADEATKALFEIDYGTSVVIARETDLGDVENINIAKISSDGTTHVIAIVDSKTKKLRTYTRDPLISSFWTKVDEGIYVGEVVDPTIIDTGTNQVAIHDAELGILQSYSWDGVAWAKLGNPLNLHAGYYSSMAKIGASRFAIVIGDSIQNRTEFAFDTEGVVNSMIFKLTGSIFLGMDYRLSDDTFLSKEKYWGFLSAVVDAYVPNVVAKDKINLVTFLNYIELMFQNFWYLALEESDPPRDFTTQIKFTQPSQFSSFGDTIDVSDQTDNLNIREYLEEILTDRENIKFNNDLNADFIGDDILYDRGTGKNIDTSIQVTTDWARVNEDLRGNDDKFEKSGIYAVQTRRDATIGNTGKTIVEAGTGILGGNNIRNEELSKSRLQDSYMKVYRFANDVNQTININGVNVPISGTCRPIINFPPVKKTLPNYPGAIAELDWGAFKSFVTEAKTDWVTGETTFDSTLLDL